MKSIKTSNVEVNKLKKGSVLEYQGDGVLNVVSEPKPELKEGDRIHTKYGYATVVRLSSRFNGLEGFNPEVHVLYVADGTAVVRKAIKDNVQLA